MIWGDIMDNRRRFSRSDTQLKAKYFLEERKGGWEECTIIDVSRTGLGVKFHTGEEISAGSTIHLEISVPTELEPISVEGILKRMEQEGDDFIGSIEFTEALDEDRFGRLS